MLIDINQLFQIISEIEIEFDTESSIFDLKKETVE